MFCKKSVYALLICKDQINLEAYCTCKQRKTRSCRFQNILKVPPSKCQRSSDRKTLYYVMEFQTNMEILSQKWQLYDKVFDKFYVKIEKTEKPKMTK